LRLVVTRPEPEASTFANELRSIGHEPVLQPLLEFRSLAFDPSAIREAQALVITSGNALRVLQQQLDIGLVANTPLFCVGAETARRAAAAGFQTICGTALTARDLANVIIASGQRERRLLHIAGERRAFDLEGALSKEGFRIRAIEVYRMQERAAFDPWFAQMMSASEIDGAILMSPRTAEIYVSLCTRHGIAESAAKLSYYCLSAEVAARLQGLGSPKLYVPQIPGRQALIGLIAQTIYQSDL